MPLPESCSLVNVFCEDIRKEESGKMSLIGVLPARGTTLPRDGSPLEQPLSIICYLRLPHTIEVQSLTLLVRNSAADPSTIEVDIDGLLEAHNQNRAAPGANLEGSSLYRLVIRTGGFSTTEPGRVHVDAKIGDEIIKGNGFRIESAADPQSAVLTDATT